MNRKNKNIGKKTMDFLKKIKFKYLNLSLSDQAIILLSFFWIFSLFMPWIIDKNNILEWNSFNSITWNIWYLMIILYIILIFIILSNSYKEKIKLYTDISFKNHFIIICSWIASISFGLISISFINWLATIWQNIIHWKWLIFSMVIWIFLIIFWVINRSNYKKTNSEIILEQLNQNREKVKEKDNMTLPI